MNTDAEVWKDLPGYGDHYEVSSRGNFRVKDRIVERRHSTGSLVKFSYKGRLLSPTNNGKGYLTVHISVGKNKTNILVHRAVLLAFVGEPKDGCEACHNNGISTDNRIENLRWDTHHKNNLDRKIHGTYHSGENHHMATLSNDEVMEIYRSNEQGIKVAEKYGIHPTLVSSIRTGKSWSSVTGGVNRGPGRGWRGK